MSKNDLIDMIITERSKKVIYTQEDDKLTKEEVFLKKKILHLK